MAWNKPNNNSKYQRYWPFEIQCSSSPNYILFVILEKVYVTKPLHTHRSSEAIETDVPFFQNFLEGNDGGRNICLSGRAKKLPWKSGEHKAVQRRSLEWCKGQKVGTRKRRQAKVTTKGSG